MRNKKEDKGSRAIGGMTLVGLGVGFVFIQTSVLLFIASLFIGIGLGLVISAMMLEKKGD